MRAAKVLLSLSGNSIAEYPDATLASSTAGVAKVVPEPLATPFRAALGHSIKLLLVAFVLKATLASCDPNHYRDM